MMTVLRPKLIFLLLIACIGCKSSQKAVQNGTDPNNEKAPDITDPAPPQISIQEYVDIYVDISRAEMERSGIPVSITLAQALLESGRGTSYLARHANNHFGIKCGGNWTGEKVYKKDDEKQPSCFRKYDNAQESFRDHSNFLTDPNKSHRYGFLFNLSKSDYHGWAHGLQKSGYATNNKYADLLIGLIERYSLTDYDLPLPQESIITVKVDSPMILHIVNPGDTLYSISKKFNVEVDVIVESNNLGSDIIQPGQQLIIPQ